MTGANPYTPFPQQQPQQAQPRPQQAQPRPQQAQPRPQQAQPRQMEYSAQPSFPTSSTEQQQPEGGGTKSPLYLALLLVGLIIFFVAGIIRSLLLYEDFIEDGQQNIYATTHLLMNIGILVLTIGLSMGALIGKNLSEKVRGSMIATVGVCIVVGFLLNVFFFYPL